MSFDVFVQDLPPDIQAVAEIPDDFKPRSLGPRSGLIDAIRRVVPAAVFDKAGWAAIEGPNYSIDVNLGTADPVQSFTFHVRGANEALFIVADILDALGLRALAAGSESGLFTLGTAAPAYAAWRAYRARVADS
jgi:hypothetical protein